MRKRPLMGATGALVALALSACGSSAASSAPSAAKSAAKKKGPVVSLKLLQFSPTTLHVTAGTTVTWRNAEPIGHTVTSGHYAGVDATSGLRSSEKPDGRFDAKLPSKGSSTSFTFRRAGTYEYYCDIHKGMNARIVVTK